LVAQPVLSLKLLRVALSFLILLEPLLVLMAMALVLLAWPDIPCWVLRNP